MLVGQAYDPRAVNGAVDVAGEPGDEGIGFATAAEEGYVDSVHVILVDQYGDVAAGLEHPQQLERRVETGRNQRAHERA